MPLKALTEVVAGSRVVVDANIFIYAANGTSNQCADFLERCAREEMRGVTTFEALAEVNHRLMLEEALAAGIVQRGSSSHLRRARRSIPNLTEYWLSVAKLLDMNLTVLDLDEGRFRRAQVMRERHGLLTIDSLVLAAAESYGIASLATRDDDFDEVPWLTVYKPGDIP
jgi:predicted nucleic acid-binding protein